MSDSDEAKHRADSQVFVKKGRLGEPVKFFLHESLTRGQQEKLEEDITNNGGILVGEAAEADTVLVHHEVYEVVAKRWDHSKTVWVEKPDFVARCLRRNEYSHAVPVKKSLGGRPAGIVRQDFTIEDDIHLAEYLACRIPYPESGGRKGYGVYRELCDPDRRETYPWAARHSVDSWRNRYRSNPVRFDKMIEDVLVYEPPHPDGKGEYQHDKRNKGIGKRPAGRHKYIKRSGREEEETDSEEDLYEAPRTTAADEEVHRRRTRNRVATEHDEMDVPGRHREEKRRKLDNDNQASPATPEQARRGQEHFSLEIGARAANNGFQDFQDLDDADLYHFDDDGDQFPPLADIAVRPAEARPSNTQATLVPTQRTSGRLEKDNVPVEASTPSMLTAERRKAARNRERTATAKPGATGKTVLSVSPPKDTQATLVATQRKVQVPIQSKANQRRAATGPASADVEDAGNDYDAEDAIIVSVTGPKPSSFDRNAQSTLASRSAAAAAPDNASRTRPVLATQQRRRAATAASQARTGTADAPYRNTRARSRSVEPMPPPPVPLPKRGKTGTAMTMVEEWEEDNEAAENDGEDNGTLDEQQSMEIVEAIIKQEHEGDDNTQSQGRGEWVKEEENEEEEDQLDDEEEDSQDAPGAFSFRARAREIEKKNLNTIESTPQQIRTPRPPFSAGHERIPSIQSRPKAVTRRAESSEGEFPTPGTRSEVAKARQEQLEKQLPFAPTPGTRAEVLRATQQRTQLARPDRHLRKAKKTATR